MKPAVHTLTIQQATEELDELMNAKPDEEDVLNLTKWKKANEDRIAELTAWVLMHQEKGKAAPVDDAPKANPTEAAKGKMAHLMDELCRATRACRAAANKSEFLRLRAHVYNWRRRMMLHASEIKIAPPAMPDIPRFKTNSTSSGVPDDVGTMGEAPLHALESARPMAPEPAMVTMGPIDIARRMRRNMWVLLTTIEDMPKGDLDSISKDIEFIAAQANEALQLIRERGLEQAG